MVTLIVGITPSLKLPLTCIVCDRIPCGHIHTFRPNVFVFEPDVHTNAPRHCVNKHINCLDMQRQHWELLLISFFFLPRCDESTQVKPARSVVFNKHNFFKNL